MPAENEIKFVLYFDLTPEMVEDKHWPKVPIKQAYLPDGPRVRQYADDFIFTYKRWIEAKNRDTEIETDLSQEDFDDLWDECDESMQKDRYLNPQNPEGYEWSIDYLQDENGTVYFVLAEVEMPEGVEEPEHIPDIIKPYIAYRVPKGDFNYSNKKLADPDHARAMLKILGIDPPSHSAPEL